MCDNYQRDSISMVFNLFYRESKEDMTGLSSFGGELEDAENSM